MNYTLPDHSLSFKQSPIYKKRYFSRDAHEYRPSHGKLEIVVVIFRYFSIMEGEESSKGRSGQ